METITKEMCIVFLKDYYKSKALSQVFTSAFVVVLLWFFTRKFYYVVPASLLLLPLCIIQGIKSKKKIRSLCPSHFYLEEDVVVDFKKRIKNSKHGAKYNYNYVFKKYGKHTISLSASPIIEIPLHKERNISSLSVDRISTESCSRGDQFYLLICDEGEKKKIVQSFYKYHFEVKTDDFNYIDGKYYCKGI